MHKVQEKLYALVPIIPEIKRLEIGSDVTHSEASMDLVLLTEFDSVDDLKTYAEHPEHLLVSGYVRKVIDRRVVIDCEI